MTQRHVIHSSTDVEVYVTGIDVGVCHLPPFKPVSLRPPLETEQIRVSLIIIGSLSR